MELYRFMNEYRNPSQDGEDVYFLLNDELWNSKDNWIDIKECEVVGFSVYNNSLVIELESELDE